MFLPKSWITLTANRTTEEQVQQGVAGAGFDAQDRSTASVVFTFHEEQDGNAVGSRSWTMLILRYYLPFESLQVLASEWQTSLEGTILVLRSRRYMYLEPQET